ncbi:hypothetical protein ACMHYO_11785 [Allopusillimonas ginsengisoli]|uniref:hypothetical protein n=1 Tax=Allopusillimonas ginsengisoli TaxID=453575 RepID=UPI0039C11A86
MSKASENIGKSLDQFVDHHGDPIVSGITVEQDWDNEATIIKFEDGTALRFSGPNCEIAD